MTKSELIEKVARSRKLSSEVTKKRVGEILDVAFEELAAYFSRTKVTRTSSPRFTYPGFGTFTKKRRNARRGVNPRTLEPMQIDAQLTLDFKPGSGLREAMNTSKGSGRKKKSRVGTRGSEKRSRTKGRSTTSRGGKPVRGDDRGGKNLRPREEVEMDHDSPDLPPARLSRTRKTTRSGLTRSG